MSPIPLIKEDDVKSDRSRYEMVAWSVPRSDDFPDGIKYRFQYMTADGDTLLWFDNAPHHITVGRHHRHTSAGDVESLDYTSLTDLADQFLTEVTKIYERRTD